MKAQHCQWPLSLTPTFLSSPSNELPIPQEYLDLQKQLSEALRQVRCTKTIHAACAHAGHAHFGITTCTVHQYRYSLSTCTNSCRCSLATFPPSISHSRAYSASPRHATRWGRWANSNTTRRCRRRPQSRWWRMVSEIRGNPVPGGGSAAKRRGDAGDGHSHGGGGW